MPVWGIELDRHTGMRSCVGFFLSLLRDLPHLHNAAVDRYIGIPFVGVKGKGRVVVVSYRIITHKHLVIGFPCTEIHRRKVPFGVIVFYLQGIRVDKAVGQ
jgi:hypothetical protein